MNVLDLLSGDARAFRDDVWASRVHLHHTDPEPLVALLSLDDVDRLLTSAALRTPALRVVKDGTLVPSKSFTRAATIAGEPLTGLVDAHKVLDLYGDGCTLVLQGLHRYWPPLTGLVRDLELALGHPCQANAYLTPPGAQGFATHADTHDVFVFQTHGSKQWTVADEQVLLGPGLVMYLPTGTPHAARSERDTSLHVTVGINRVTVRQVLRRVAEHLLSDSRYDEPLPAGYLDDPDRLARRLGDELAVLAKDVHALDAATVAEDRVAHFLTDRVPALRGGLLDRSALSGIDDDTELERRPTATCLLRPGTDRVRVLLGDRELRVPVRILPAMTFVRDHDAFRVADLPGLDSESRLVLARRLVREGLLRIKQ